MPSNNMLRVNRWCKLHIIVFVISQVYFFKYDLPCIFAPTFILILLSLPLVLIARNSNRLGTIARVAAGAALALNVFPLALMLFFMIFWRADRPSLSLDLYAQVGSIGFSAVGLFLFSKHFFIDPRKHTFRSETRLCIIIVAIILFGVYHFSGGPTLPRTALSDSAVPYVRREVDRLYSLNPKERAEAVKRLHFFPEYSAKAIPFLISMLKDEAIYARKGNEEQAVKNNVVSALVAIGKPCYEPLLQLLHSPDVADRISAIRSFSLFQNTRTIDAVIPSCGDPEPEVRIEALKKLASLANRLRDHRAIAILCEALGDPRDEVRRAAAEGLRETSDPRIVEPLIRALDDNNPEVVKRAGLALNDLTGKDFGSDSKRWADWWASEKDQFFYSKFMHERSHIENIVSYSLSHLSDPQDAELLKSALRDPRTNVKRSALWMIERTKCHAAIEELFIALNDMNPDVQKPARRSLFIMTGRDLGDDSETWERWWQEEKIDFMRNPAQYIEAHSDELFSSLIKTSDSGLNIVLAIGRPALPALVRLLDEGDDFWKRVALNGLASTQDLRAIEPLINGLEAESTALRSSAAHSLRQLCGEDFQDSADNARAWWKKEKKMFLVD